MLTLPLPLLATLTDAQSDLIGALRHDGDNSLEVTALADDHPELLMTLVQGLLDGTVTGPDVILGDLVEALGQSGLVGENVHALLLRALRHADPYVQRTGLDALVHAHRCADLNLALVLTEADLRGIPTPLRSLLPRELRPLTLPEHLTVTDAEWTLLRHLTGRPDDDEETLVTLAHDHVPLLIGVLRAAAERHPHLLVPPAVLANLVTALGCTQDAPATTRHVLSRLLNVDDLLIQERALRALLVRLEGGDHAVRLLLPRERLRDLPDVLGGYWRVTYAQVLALDDAPDWLDKDGDGRLDALHDLSLQVNAEGYWPQAL